ncbi:MAG: hypothetical protein KDC54_02180 [Lewinella sp.]|nr:hypothetical protein [Lewinella sp.]
MLGSRGKGALAQILVGSVALAVMKTEWHFPVLIVQE